MNEKQDLSVGWKWIHAIPVSEVKILQTALSQEWSGMMLSSKLRTSFLYKSLSPWCWFYLRVDYPLTDLNLYGRVQGLALLLVSQGICLQIWWFFLGLGCMHPSVQMKTNTLVICAHLEVWINMFSCDSSRSLRTHLQPARPLYLPSLKLGINTEEYPGIWLPHSNRCTTTQTNSQTQPLLQLVLTKWFPLTGQFVWFLLLFHCVCIDVFRLLSSVTLQICCVKSIEDSYCVPASRVHCDLSNYIKDCYCETERTCTV